MLKQVQHDSFKCFWLIMYIITMSFFIRNIFSILYLHAAENNLNKQSIYGSGVISFIEALMRGACLSVSEFAPLGLKLRIARRGFQIGRGVDDTAHPI